MDDDSYGITILHQPEENTRVVLDLVAIHGLNGHALQTWTHKQTRTMWLRDLLPESLPNVRIMTYGYNAKFRNFTGHQDLRSISMKLLAELVDLRKTDEEIRRPVIFVCHSLGGIVAKKALLLGCPDEQTRVQQAVYGIVFLGTPHNGSSIATCGKLIANIVAACSPISPATMILGALQKDSTVLFEITEDFVEKTSRLQLVSFFEMEMTSFGFFRRMIVEHRSAILNVPSEIAIGQNADHRDLVRFSSLHDRNFRPVLSRLKKLRDDIVNKDTSSSHIQIGIHALQLEGNAMLFDIPHSTCNVFHGREDLLTQMDNYFNRSSSSSHDQLTFAICGLGGSGKTKAALQYAIRNRARYTSGVWFFNADSNATLIADFERISDLLKLGRDSNKVGSTKRWLSKEENSKWLLIFDNADDLDSVRISKYLPAVPWGHIIITSRDQAATGNVGKEGYLMGSLKEEEAVAVLLEKAGVAQPTVEEFDKAREIVKLLGCLPLAVDQGGAFIRARRKTLADYHRLFEAQQREVLTFKPRLAEYDKTVLTAWEVNFKQVESDTEGASDLLLLFCFLDAGEISEMMLSRGCSPQSRWDYQGEISKVTAEEAGLDPGVVELVMNEMQFDAAIEKLLSFSLIQLQIDSNGLRSFALHPLVQYSASQRVPITVQNKWRLQAILLVCHAFPREKYLEPVYGSIGRSLLPHVHRVLKEYEVLTNLNPMPQSVRREIASMLLGASRFSDTSWKRLAINLVKDLLQDNSDCYMHAWAVHRESALLRMFGNLQQSNQALESFIHGTVFPGHDIGVESDAKWNAQRGGLVVSFAESLIQDNDLTRAKNELLEWKPIHPKFPSTLEGLVLRSRNVALGKILRCEGHFSEALSCFEELLEESGYDQSYEGTGERRVLLSNLADLYCELDQPTKGQAILQPELKQIADRGGKSINSVRRLQLSMIETLLRLRLFDKAEESSWKLEPVYETISNPDALTSIGHFRLWTGLARISHLTYRWDEALLRWKRALKILEDRKWVPSYNSGIVRFSISHVLYKLQNLPDSSAMMEKAKTDLDSEGRKFWIVSLGSYWYDYITAQDMPDMEHNKGYRQ